MRLLIGLLAALPLTTLAAQGYRVRLDTRFQSVAFRGLELDSIPAGSTVTGPDGGPETPDGYAVHCAAGDAYCTFFRPGARRQGAPVVTTASITAWGFGIRGVSTHVTARAGADLGNAGIWPGTRPALQLLDGYVEYAAPRWTARAGRQLQLSRLGASGFDGASVTGRISDRGLEGTVYAGWGLGRGTALPVTSPALNPLDDFQPRRRQLVAGFDAGWTGQAASLRLNYRREVDPRSDYFVSERLAFSAAARPAAGLSVSAGADYDLAAGWWGSAELALAYATRTLTASVEARRYRPHFDLWTIWGAFSPVPYRSLRGDLTWRASGRLQLHARGERYAFDNPEAETPLVTFERDGWRAELGLTVRPAAAWSLDAGYTREYGPGAAAVGTGAGVTYAPSRDYRITAYGSSLDRPLEFRFSESVLKMIGLDGDARLSERIRITLGAVHYSEQRERPDAAAIDWDQWRINAGVTVQFARGGDLGNLPPATRRMPGGRSAR